MSDLTKREDIAAHMKAATSRADWNRRTDQVKAANNGSYSVHWSEDMFTPGGIYEQVSKTWQS
jgi:hypothetical protein